MLNQVNIMGRLTQTPTVMYSQGGRAMSFLTVACRRNYRAADGSYETDFIDAVCWGRLAEHVCRRLKKGSPVVVSGHLSRWQRRDTAGSKIYELQLVADQVHFISGGVGGAAAEDEAADREMAAVEADFEAQVDADALQAAVLQAPVGRSSPLFEDTVPGRRSAAGGLRPVFSGAAGEAEQLPF